MKCQICLENDSKYKCPSCLISYCTLVCYKSPKHIHQEKPLEIDQETEKKDLDEGIQGTNITNTTESCSQAQLFEKIIQDDVIKQYLNQDSLQFHLSVLIKILNNHDGIIEPKAVNDTKMVMNLKLLNLRLGGIEENELVEEFVQRILLLMNEG